MVSTASKNRHSAQRPLRGNAGFTLVELLTVTSIVALLLAIGVPSFRFVTSSNRATTEINGLLGDLQFARGEAIREGQTVKVCSSNDGATCLNTGSTWTTGWLVMSGTTLLRVQAPFSGTDILQADNSINTVSFNRDGFSAGLPGAIKFTLHSSPTNAQYTRCLSVTIIGVLTTQKGGALTAGGTAC